MCKKKKVQKRSGVGGGVRGLSSEKGFFLSMQLYKLRENGVLFVVALGCLHMGAGLGVFDHALNLVWERSVCGFYVVFFNL